MSLDNFVECSACKAHKAVNVWIRLYGSLVHARAQQGSDLFSALTPQPVAIKIEICFSCRRFAPADYTKEEIEQLEKDAKEQLQKNSVAEKIVGLFGFPKKEAE